MNTKINNHCNTCKYTSLKEKGHCYMFLKEPKFKCLKHMPIPIKPNLKSSGVKLDKSLV